MPQTTPQKVDIEYDGTKLRADATERDQAWRRSQQSCQHWIGSSLAYDIE